MSIARTVAAGVFVFGAMGTYAHGDPLLSSGEAGNWTFWNSGAPVRLSFEPDSSSELRTSPLPPAPTIEPAPSSSMASTGVNSGGNADAFINLGNGPYPNADNLTTGGAQPWYTSPVVTKFFGGQQPDAQQQADFANSVL